MLRITLLLLLLQEIQLFVVESADCLDWRDDPACLDHLVAMPQVDTNCDGPQGCRLHFLLPDEQPTPEELKEVHHEPNQEFKQTLKQSGNDGGGGKTQNTKPRTVGERLTLLESGLMSMTSLIQKLQEESKFNLSKVEDRLNSLVVLLLGILSGCELPCNESVQKLSALGKPHATKEFIEGLLPETCTHINKPCTPRKPEKVSCPPLDGAPLAKESRRLKALETKEEGPMTLKSVGNAVSQVAASSEKPERMFPRDCADIYKQGIRENGIYTIQPIALRQPFEVFCDMATDGGGWTVFQRRLDGTTDFNRTWQDYKQGFGSLQGEHWLGNENLHSLTRLGQHTLRVELEDWYGVKRHAIYRKFKVASEQNKYRLTAREYSGNAGNALSYSRNYNHDHKYFTTYDSDNDNYPSGNCGMYYGSGWWFDTCLAANLNGKYHKGRYTGVTSGIYWGTWYILTDKRTNQKYSFKKVEMKTRIFNS